MLVDTRNAMLLLVFGELPRANSFKGLKVVWTGFQTNKRQEVPSFYAGPFAVITAMCTNVFVSGINKSHFTLINCGNVFGQIYSD